MLNLFTKQLPSRNFPLYLDPSLRCDLPLVLPVHCNVSHPAQRRLRALACVRGKAKTHRLPTVAQRARQRRVDALHYRKTQHDVNALLDRANVVLSSADISRAMMFGLHRLPAALRDDVTGGYIEGLSMPVADQHLITKFN